MKIRAPAFPTTDAIDFATAKVDGLMFLKIRLFSGSVLGLIVERVVVTHVTAGIENLRVERDDDAVLLAVVWKRQAARGQTTFSGDGKRGLSPVSGALPAWCSYPRGWFTSPIDLKCRLLSHEMAFTLKLQVKHRRQQTLQAYMILRLKI